jgi:thiamine-phosphate pyrophosphorylase
MWDLGFGIWDLPILSPLQAIVDVDAAARAGWAPLDVAKAFLDGGARLLQLRGKSLASGPLLDLADAVVRAAAACEALVIVNDRVDVACMSGAAGVHVGQDDLRPADARRLLGPEAIVGYSTHSMAQVRAALSEPVTYIAVGPVFGTRSKDTGYAAVGLDLVSEAARVAGSTPVVAIGGITLSTARSVLDAGAQSVAVIGDLLVGHDLAARTRAYLQALARHRV